MRKSAWLLILVLFPVTMPGQHRGRNGTTVPLPTTVQPSFKGVVATFAGTLKNLKKKEILLDLDDSHELMTFRRTKETKFTDDGVAVKATSIDLESHVMVDATQDTGTMLRAVAVRAGKEPKAPAK